MRKSTSQKDLAATQNSSAGQMWPAGNGLSSPGTYEVRGPENANIHKTIAYR